jgi:predicted nucleic acid-binding protein
LALIGQSEVLPALFVKVIIPSVVRDELDRAQTPAAVRKWIQSPPAWLELHPYL